MIFVCMCACVCSLLNRLPWCPQHSTSLGYRTDLDWSISRSNGPSEGWKPQNVIGQSRGGVWLVVRCKGLYSGSRLLYGYYASSYFIRDYWTIHGCHCVCESVFVFVKCLETWRAGGWGHEKNMKPKQKKKLRTHTQGKEEVNKENKDISPGYELFFKIHFNPH